MPKRTALDNRMDHHNAKRIAQLLKSFAFSEQGNTEETKEASEQNVNSQSNLSFEHDSSWEEMVCEGLGISLYSTYTVLLWFAISCCLSKSDVKKLLYILQMFLQKENRLVGSKYQFYKLFDVQKNMQKYGRIYPCNPLLLIMEIINKNTDLSPILL